MQNHSSLKAASALALAVMLSAPGLAFAYNNKDAIRDCENSIRREYGLMDLRESRSTQLPGEKRYRVEGKAKVEGDKYPWTCEIDDRRVVDTDYRGRRPRPVGGGSGGGAPEVVQRRSGELEVRMPSGCTALYDEEGVLINRGSSCSSSDRQRAEKAVDSYLREQGSSRGRGGYGDSRESGRQGRDDDDSGRGRSQDENRDRGDGGDGGGSSPPEIMAGTNGEAEVIFKNNCVVYYNPRGRRTEALPKCSDRQIEKADQAIRAYRREQGL